MAYRKGNRITSLDELSQQEFVYIFHKVTHCGWFMSFQLRFALDMIRRGVIFKAEREATDNGKQ